jgi:hypothetical protein
MKFHTLLERHLVHHERGMATLDWTNLSAAACDVSSHKVSLKHFFFM